MLGKENCWKHLAGQAASVESNKAIKLLVNKREANKTKKVYLQGDQLNVSPEFSVCTMQMIN